MMEGKIRAKHPSPRTARMAGHHQTPRRGEEGSSPKTFRGEMVPPTPSFWTSGLQNWERTSSYCFRPPVCSSSSQRPQQTDAVCLPRVAWPGLNSKGPQGGVALREHTSPILADNRVLQLVWVDDLATRPNDDTLNFITVEDCEFSKLRPKGIQAATF